jgi:hypothetical protein
MTHREFGRGAHPLIEARISNLAAPGLRRDPELDDAPPAQDRFDRPSFPYRPVRLEPGHESRWISLQDAAARLQWSPSIIRELLIEQGIPIERLVGHKGAYLLRARLDTILSVCDSTLETQRPNQLK